MDIDDMIECLHIFRKYVSGGTVTVVGKEDTFCVGGVGMGILPMSPKDDERVRCFGWLPHEDGSLMWKISL